jgi:hypothetical protein
MKGLIDRSRYASSWETPGGGDATGDSNVERHADSLRNTPLSNVCIWPLSLQSFEKEAYSPEQKEGLSGRGEFAASDPDDERILRQRLRDSRQQEADLRAVLHTRENVMNVPNEQGT